MPQLDGLPSPGQIVRARARRYLVEDVTLAPSPGDDTRVRLACLDDDAQGEPLEVLWERELDAEVLSASSWALTPDRGFDPSPRFAAYLRTLRWGCVTATQPRLFQAPYRAGIQVRAYQLEPLRKALSLPYASLFVADDVGLGKTIEAGLVLRELMLRQKVRRVVVACPPSVVLQWRDELLERFGLRFMVYDRAFSLARRRERGWATNPFTTHNAFIVSHALLRDEAHASLLRDWITADDHLRPEDRDPALFILDEAHNAAPASGQRYAVDSHLTGVVRELAPLFEHRLFLSATPHNGHSNSFSALLEILDPHRFCRGVPVVPRHRDTVMVRRLKGDLKEIGETFPTRHVEQIDIDGLPEDAPDLALMRLLDEYRAAREERLSTASKSERNAGNLVTTALQKRLLSSIEAFACTLAVHRKSFEKSHNRRSPPEAAAQLSFASIDSAGPDDERDDDDTEAESAAAEAAAVEIATEASAAPAASIEAERALLAQMISLAETARHEPDPRVRHLVDWIQANCLSPGARTWNHRRVLVFTEYGDTKRYLEQQLRSLLARTDRADERILTFHGGMDDERREDVKRAFTGDPDEHPLRILIATDAAREGINLQQSCADLFHFDVPWNPSRMEQRNGRIDRKGQPRKDVYCRYFVFAQRPEDRVLTTLVKKTSVIHDELGSLAQVVEARLARLLEEGIARPRAGALSSEIESTSFDPDRREVIRAELEEARERQVRLQKQIHGLEDLMDTARKALGLDPVAFRAALDLALSLHDSPPLAPLPGEPGVYKLPDTSPLLSDRSWTDTLDLLRSPRRRGEKHHEWRKRAPIRPVVFEDSGHHGDKRVHLHLEHRFAQRLLGRLTAQGFVHNDMARATAVLADGGQRRVLLFARLSLYGDRAARLHDEIFPVAARWIYPESRTEPLSPFAAQGTQSALSDLESAFSASRPVPPDALQKLLAAAERDVSELLPHIHAAADERARRAQDLLHARGEAESRDMEQVLTAQNERLRAQMAAVDSPQLSLAIGPFADEKRQLEADKRHWTKRLKELESEQRTEPARIRRTYEVRARRVEPVGLAYLWPVSG
ncbi:MAG: DISARM system SNF2-like helicase DrmD [Polyangiaceae bacterium]